MEADAETEMRTLKAVWVMQPQVVIDEKTSCKGKKYA